MRCGSACQDFPLQPARFLSPHSGGRTCFKSDWLRHEHNGTGHGFQPGQSCQWSVSESTVTVGPGGVASRYSGLPARGPPSAAVRRSQYSPIWYSNQRLPSPARHLLRATGRLQSPLVSPVQGDVVSLQTVCQSLSIRQDTCIAVVASRTMSQRPCGSRRLCFAFSPLTKRRPNLRQFFVSSTRQRWLRPLRSHQAGLRL